MKDYFFNLSQKPVETYTKKEWLIYKVAQQFKVVRSFAQDIIKRYKEQLTLELLPDGGEISSIDWSVRLKKIVELTPLKWKVGIIAIIVSAIFLVIPPFSLKSGAWVWAEWTGLSSEPSITKVTEIIEKTGVNSTTKHITTENDEDGPKLVDWINTLLAPLALTVVGYWLQQQQERRAEEQAELDKEIAYTNLCEEALQSYFDRLAELLLDQQLAILSKEGLVQEIALNVIRARTLSILRRLGEDKERKGNIVRFLIDAELMSKVNLSEADLRNADLTGINLENTNLRSADLENADLRNADLRGAKLENANLRSANLADAKLENVDLREANLTSTNLAGAKLMNANMRGANLENADLSSARLQNANLRSARLENANLSDAKLENASLVNADLRGAKLENTNLLNADMANARLENANLLNANLAGTDLMGTDLRGALNMEPAQIEAANNEVDAIYDEGVREILGLPPEGSSIQDNSILLKK